jgi:hypothetical protein
LRTGDTATHDNPEAHNAFLLGKHAFAQQRDCRGGRALARAIVIDARYAPACGLSRTRLLWLTPALSALESGYAQARADVNQALASTSLTRAVSGTSGGGMMGLARFRRSRPACAGARRDHRTVLMARRVAHEAVWRSRVAPASSDRATRFGEPALQLGLWRYVCIRFDDGRRSRRARLTAVSRRAEQLCSCC